MKQSRGFALIAILLIIILSIGIVFLLLKLSIRKTSNNINQPPSFITPTIVSQTNNSNWLTYKSTDNVFTIDYPPNIFRRLICPDEEFTAVTITNPETSDENPKYMSNCNRDSRYNIEIVKIENTPNYPESGRYQTVVKQFIKIGELSAIEFTITANLVKNPTEEDSFALTVTPPWRKEIFIKRDSKTYLIYFADEEHEELLPQILSTLRFDSGH